MGHGNGLRKLALLFLSVFSTLTLSSCASENNYDMPREWNPCYNTHEHSDFVCIEDPTVYNRTMTEGEIIKILPNKPLPFDLFDARVGFQKDMTTYKVVLYIGSPDRYFIIVLGEGARFNACCSFRNKGDIVSQCGSVRYTLYESESDLMAEAEINGVSMFARTSGSFGTNDKQEFEAILECFSWYSFNAPRIDGIRP